MRNWKTFALAGVAGVSVLALIPVGASASSPAAGVKHEQSAVKPTVVLVHGAWADASGWNDVTAKLQAKGYTVVAPPNLLRSLDEDSAYLKSFLATISGPIVLVGHSYGGAVITNAATGNPNVKSLVYISAYAPDQGETIAEAGALNGGDNSVLVSHLIKRAYPNTGGYVDTTVDPAWFPKLFAADAPLSKTKLMATQQRPLSSAAFEGETGVPAWKSITSYYLVSLDDKTIPPVAEKAMAARAAKGRTVEIHSSHAAMVAHPAAVTDLILRAARS
ncbi:alpha/beta hydrolase [Actinoplanes sp. OR16]|uniref:alpha/beta fold hydrolase n=1 Tax=Actinoplanes sp. OR16 TaxID=946334 RepID=UPI000F6D1F71|nr:alpha/beta hydrolase [Actinoplanes sp. OR16]BBH69859.1 alpha/beta hydrolase [Actinoplanes sp. OR16]